MTPILTPLQDMLKSKKAIALVASLAIVGVLCYFGRVAGTDMLHFAEVVVAAYLAAEGVAKIGSDTSSDTPPTTPARTELQRLQALTAQVRADTDAETQRLLALDRDTEPKAPMVSER